MHSFNEHFLSTFEQTTELEAGANSSRGVPIKDRAETGMKQLIIQLVIEL